MMDCNCPDDSERKLLILPKTIVASRVTKYDISDVYRIYFPWWRQPPRELLMVLLISLMYHGFQLRTVGASYVTEMVLMAGRGGSSQSCNNV